MFQQVLNKIWFSVTKDVRNFYNDVFQFVTMITVTRQASKNVLQYIYKKKQKKNQIVVQRFSNECG